MTDHERPANPLEGLIVEAVLPVADVDTRIDDRPHGSRDLDALGAETRATPRHEAPELFHFDDALDREPYSLCVAVDAQHAAGASDCPLVDEERATSVSAGGPPRDLSHRHIIAAI
jgi:hypothetical protein